MVSSGAGTRAAGKLSDASRAEFLAAANAVELRELARRLADTACSPAMLSQLKPGDTPIYGLSKMALNYYTRLLAREHPTLRINACSPGFCRTDIAGAAADYSKREPKDPTLGADVVFKLLMGTLGEGTGKFYKEISKPGTPLAEARSTEQPWVA